MALPLEVDAGDQPAAVIEPARASLRHAGIVVVKRAFDWRAIAPLLDAARRHAEAIVQSIRGETPRKFPPQYRWVDESFACDISALDPNTANDAGDDFNRTSLHNAIMEGPTAAIVSGEIGENAGYAVVRTRTILPNRGRNGGLALHKERTAVGFPGVHVVWTALVPPEVVTNGDAPGIEFELDAGAWYRPELRAGDVAIFNGDVLHGTHIPVGATHWRVGCDIRLFPWTPENHLPAAVIAMGYGPRRLVWRK